MQAFSKYCLFALVSTTLALTACKPRRDNASSTKSVGIQVEGGGFDLIYLSDDNFVNRVRCPEAKIANCDEKNPLNVKMPLELYKSRLAKVLGFSSLDINHQIEFVDAMEERIRARYMEIMTAQESTDTAGWVDAQVKLVNEYKSKKYPIPDNVRAIFQQLEKLKDQVATDSKGDAIAAVLEGITEYQLSIDSLGRVGGPRAYTEILKNLPKDGDSVSLIASGEMKGRKKVIYEYALVALDEEANVQIANTARKQELAEKPFSCSIRCLINDYAQTFNGPVVLNGGNESQATQLKTNFATIEKAFESALEWCDGEKAIDEKMATNGRNFRVLDLSSLTCRKYNEQNDAYQDESTHPYKKAKPLEERKFSQAIPVDVTEGTYYPVGPAKLRCPGETISQIVKKEKSTYSFERQWITDRDKSERGTGSCKYDASATYSCKVLDGNTTCTTDKWGPIVLRNSVPHTCSFNNGCNKVYDPKATSGQTVSTHIAGQHYVFNGQLYVKLQNQNVFYGEQVTTKPGEKVWQPGF